MAKKSFRFGRSQHLIGIVHEAKPQAGQGRRGVLMWNTGISHRVGPYRSQFALAEDLALRGFTVLRFDLSRLGDSEDSGEKINFQDSNSRDLGDALELLAEQYAIEEFILIGLCSSAVDAFYFARTEARIKGLVMVDTFVYPTWQHRWLHLWQRVRSYGRWKSLIKRRILRLKEAAPLLVGDTFEANYPPPHEARDGLRLMVARGTQILVIYTGGFTPYFSHRQQFTRMLGASDFGPGLELLLWPETDHLFTMLEDRSKFASTLLHWMDQHFNEGVSPSPELWSQDAEAALPLAAQEPRFLEQEPSMAASTSDPRPSASADRESTAELPSLREENEEREIASLLAIILKTYSEILAPLTPSAEDNFFDCGASSLQAIRAAALLSERLQRDISVVDIFAAPIAQDFAAALVRTAPPPSAAPQAKIQHGEGIAIIGLACKVPGANDARELWELITSHRTAITRFSKEELDPSLPAALVSHPDYVPARGVIAGDRFDAAFFGINRREALYMDPQQRILLETCWQALEDAGYSRARRDLKVAVYAGVGGNTYFNRNVMQGHALPHSEEEDLAQLVNDKDFVATRIAHALDLKGPAISVHTACSTSLVAVIEASKSLLFGEADIALAGAASVHAPIHSGQLYQEGGIFSRDGSCRPFASDASGTMFSDGSAVVVLKRLSDAERDGDTIYAVIRSWGLSNDGADKNSFAGPSVKGQAAAIRQAFDRVDWSPRSIAYVECHGTATPIGDPIEIEGLRRGFGLSGEAGPSCALGSIKAQVGHLTAAAGTIGLIKLALSLRARIIPPAFHSYPLNPRLRLEQSPFYVPREALAWPGPGPRRGAISSFGVGGTNAHLLLEEAPAPRPLPDSLASEDPCLVLSWSAREAETCSALGQRLAAFVSATRPSPRALSSTLYRDREAFAWRQTAVAWHENSLGEALKQPAPPEARSKTPLPLVLLFPGQGSQYPQMGFGLASVWPRFARHYQHVLARFQQLCDLPLQEIVQSQSTDAAARLQETLYTQPALFSIEWALAQSFIEAGLEPQALIGHSIGELAAACIAGIFQLDDAVRIVHARAVAMQSAPPGAMLAARASWEKIAPLLDPALALAARNGPEAVVIAGPAAAIDAAALQLRAASIASRRLETSHAFHSPMMDSILDQYARIFADVSLQAPRLAIYSSVTGQVLTAEQAQSPEYWVQQIRQAVDFAGAVTHAQSAGPVLTFELGPKAALSRLLPQILNKRGGPAISSLSEGKRETEALTLQQAIARLWNHGYELFKPSPQPRIPAPAYPFQGERLWLDPKPESGGSGNSSPGSGGLNLPQAAPRHDALLAQLQTLLADISGIALQQLSPEASWSALGLDSLLLIQWVFRVQKEWDVKLSLQQLQGPLPHLRALQAYIAQEKGLSSVLVPKPESPVPLAVRPAPSGSSEALHELLLRQTQLMEQQLGLLSQLLRRLPPLPAEEAPFWESLPVDGEIELHTDQGVQRLPYYRGAILSKDSQGQPALFIEDPRALGEFWQIGPLN